MLCTFTGKQHKYIYFKRTIPNLEDYLHKLDEMVTERFIPTLIEGAVSQKGELSKLMEDTPTDHESSKKLTAPLVAWIILHSDKLPAENKTTKNEIVKKKEQDYWWEKQEAERKHDTKRKTHNW